MWIIHLTMITLVPICSLPPHYFLSPTFLLNPFWRILHVELILPKHVKFLFAPIIFFHLKMLILYFTMIICIFLCLLQIIRNCHRISHCQLVFLISFQFLSLIFQSVYTYIKYKKHTWDMWMIDNPSNHKSLSSLEN